MESNQVGMPGNDPVDLSVQQDTLLFVDDENNILTSLKRLFRREGYRVMTAESGMEGLSLLEAENVDLVISDMRMPEMDGVQFLEKVASKWPNTVRILLTGFADMQSTIDAINKGSIYKYVSKPWDDHELKLSVKYALDQKKLKEERDCLLIVTEEQNLLLKDLNENLEQKVEKRTEALRKAGESLKKNYLSSIKTFAGIIAAREGANTGHARRIAEQARKIANDMKLSQKECQDVLFAGLLHDIGKIGFSDRILSRAVSEMNPEELEEYKKHPVLGEAMLTSLEGFQDVAKLIRHHHEHFNGSGYPDGLTANEIPKGAMILSMLSDYDDFMYGFMDGGVHSHLDAVKYINAHTGTRYHPEIVNLLMKRFDLGESVCRGESVRVGSHQLEPGMVLSEDLYVEANILLLAKDHVLDERFIDKILSFENSMKKRFKISIWREMKQENSSQN